MYESIGLNNKTCFLTDDADFMDWIGLFDKRIKKGQDVTGQFFLSL